MFPNKEHSNFISKLIYKIKLKIAYYLDKPYNHISHGFSYDSDVVKIDSGVMYIKPQVLKTFYNESSSKYLPMCLAYCNDADHVQVYINHPTLLLPNKLLNAFVDSRIVLCTFVNKLVCINRFNYKYGVLYNALEFEHSADMVIKDKISLIHAYLTIVHICCSFEDIKYRDILKDHYKERIRNLCEAINYDINSDEAQELQCKYESEYWESYSKFYKTEAINS